MDPRKITSRKEQRIKQLLTAKEQILNELAQYEQQQQQSVSSGYQGKNGQNRNKKSSSRQLPSLKGSSLKYGRPSSTAVSTANNSIYSEATPANLMLNFPSLTSTSSLKKKGMIKLPIFRLPTPDANLLALQQQLNNTNTNSNITTSIGAADLQTFSSYPTTQSPTKSPKRLTLPPSTASIMQKQFVPCKDAKLVVKTFLLLLQQLTSEEKMKVANELYLAPSEVDQIIQKLKDSPPILNGEVKQQPPGEELLTTLLSPHEYLTLFITAQFYLQQEQNNSDRFSSTAGRNWLGTASKEGDNRTLLPSIEALRVASHEFDFTTIGVSEEFKSYLLLENNDYNRRQSAYPMTRGGNFTAGNTIISTAPSSSLLERNNSFKQMFAPPLQKSLSAPSIDVPTSNGKFDFYSSQLSSTTNSLVLPPTAVRGNRLNTSVSTAAGGKHRQGTALPPPTAIAARSTAQTSQRHRSSNKDPITSSSSTTLLSSVSADPNQLSSELLKSLLNVQRHTSLVKKSLENAQSFVTLGEYHQQQQQLGNHSTMATTTPISSSKAKEVIMMLGSQKLAKSLHKLILTDLKRGLLTWKLYIIQYYRTKQMASLIKVITFRNVLIALQKILWRILRKYINLWKHQVHEINIILRRKRLLSAIIKIQSFFRQMIAKEKVRVKKHRKKYELLYESTIKIQSMLRGKRLRWRFLKYQRDKKERIAATLIQKMYRGYSDRRRVYFMRLRKNKHMAAVVIQKMIRGKLIRNLFRRLIFEKRRKRAAAKIQALVRGFITRKNISTLLINRARYEYAVIIQKIMRGYLTRKNIQKKIRQLQEYKQNRLRAVVKMQSSYRMYRSKVFFRILLIHKKLEQNKQSHAATKINTMIRGFLAKQYRKQLVQERLENWIFKAKEWTEVWSDDTQSYYYYNNVTGESIWEPMKEGYIRHDGRLLLESGEIIDDPDAVNATDGSNTNNDFFNFGGQGNNNNTNGTEKKTDKKKTKKQLAKLCNECQERTAIRLCNECGDQFCTKCYKSLHLLGARRHHTYKLLGPKDCNECEDVLAVRMCITCDEHFCDGCWRRLHSHGKRIFHPYSEISVEGRIDKRVFTMDGDQLNDGYDAAYSQQRLDSNQVKQMSALLSEQEIQQQNQNQFWEEANNNNQYQESGGDYYSYDPNVQADGGGYNEYGVAADPYASENVGSVAGGEEWAQYYDENGYLYYYNNYTGQSQYESPY